MWRIFGGRRKGRAMAETSGGSPRILDVGQCNFDHRRIAGVLTERLGATVDRAHGLDEARGLMAKSRYDLVLVNRLLDADQTPGVDVIRSIKEDLDPKLAGVPMMLVSNYPEAQQAAVDVGAEPGFGKADLNRDETVQRIASLLG